MLRPVLCAILAVGLFTLVADGADPKPKTKPAKGQMVKGTIKSVDVKAGVLVVNQKLKTETVERQLDIKPETEWSITIDGKTVEASGKDGLAMIDGKVGASVQVKCDKDVNVLKVTVKVGK
jgi:hypothetical protein